MAAPVIESALLTPSRRRQRLLQGCAVKRRRFPMGESPIRQLFQPEATGATVEVTKQLKPSVKLSRNTVTVQVCRP